MQVPPLPEEALAYSGLFDRENLENTMRWCGYKVQKTPADMWVYQEIITDTRPDLLLEIGSAAGGSGLFFASVMEALGTGQVLSFDTQSKWQRPVHPRLEFTKGDPRDLVDGISKLVRDEGFSLMVVEDAAHTHGMTLGCVEAFAPLVPRGHYYVVEDTDLHRQDSSGVWRAVREFIEANPGWEIDWSREKFHHTTCHGGFLRRKR